MGGALGSVFASALSRVLAVGSPVRGGGSLASAVDAALIIAVGVAAACAFGPRLMTRIDAQSARRSARTERQPSGRRPSGLSPAPPTDADLGRMTEDAIRDLQSA